MIPGILKEIEEALRTAGLTASEKVMGEGRGGSLKDEGTVIDFLLAHPTIGPRVMETPPRRPGDFMAQDDNGVWHPVNIKTSTGTYDNATSKLGFLYAYTDLDYDDLPGRITWNTLYDKLNSHKKDVPGRDYYFLFLDKRDMSKVLVRGTRQITHWFENANPSNLLQIIWRKEVEEAPKEQSFEEAYDTVIGGIGRCMGKTVHSWPPEFFVEGHPVREAFLARIAKKG